MTRPSTRGKDIVSGQFGDELVFIPADRARYLARTWQAMFKAKTWGALKRFAPPKAYREILAFQESPRSIRGWHPFDYYQMTPVPDGDYPGFPEQEVMEWMPREIWQVFGRMEVTFLNGGYPSFDPTDARMIVTSLKQHAATAVGAIRDSLTRLMAPDSVQQALCDEQTQANMPEVDLASMSDHELARKKHLLSELRAVAE